jgi:glutamate racemase
MDSNKAIGVFDSGIGGLSVLKQFIRFLPYEKYVYLGDTARVPYGNRSIEAVRQYSRECTGFLLEQGVKMIVVACNTASSVAMDAIREVADVPVVGMIMPTVGAAIRATINGRIGVIGTRATINSGAYSESIYRLAGSKKVKVFAQPCPLFVPFVEEGWTRHQATRIVAEEYLSKLATEEIDTLVLGCTHYPLLSGLIAEILPGVTLIDSGEHAAVSSVRMLAESKELAPEQDEILLKPDIKFFVTDIPATFFEQANRFLGFTVDSPQKVTAGWAVPR